MAKTKKRPLHIIKDGREFVSPGVFADLFFYETSQIFRCRKNGMPYIKFNGYFYYNVEDCEKWHAGIYEEA